MTLLKKGVIEIIFISEILAKFLCSEGSGQWHHIMVCTACIGYLHILLVWAIVFIRYKAMREAPLKDKGSKVPTPLLYIIMAFSGDWRAEKELL